MKKVLAAAGIGAALITSSLAVAGTANATTSREQGFLNLFVATGGYIYDSDQLIRSGYDICARFSYMDGNQNAREVFRTSSWADVPNLHEAARWVQVAANTLCPEVWANTPVRSIY